MAGRQLVVLAGGGVEEGREYGASDRIGAFPAESPVGPIDLGASLLHLLGVRPETVLRDRAGRPIPGSTGAPVFDLLS